MLKLWIYVSGTLITCMQVFTVLFTAIYKVMHELRTHFNRMCIILVGGHLAESTHFDLLRTYVAVCERT